MEQEAKARLTRYIREHSKTLPLDTEVEPLRDWLKCIEFLWESVGKKIDGNAEEDKRFDAYTKIFAGVPIGILEPAIVKAISNNGKYNVIPTPGAIWDAIRKSLEIRDGEDAQEVINNWIQVEHDKCFVRFEAVQS